MRERVLELLRPAVPYDGHVFALTDPVTRVATAPHADVPMLPWDRLPETIRWRYLTTLNRVDQLVGRPAASLLGTGDASDSPLWQHVLREVGVVDTATVAFADPYGTWAYLDLWRTTEPFTAADLAVLTGLVGPVTAGLRAALARTFVDPAEQLLPVGPAVVLLGPDLVVHQLTEGAATALFTLLPPDELRAPIPAAAYNLAAALLAEEAGIPVGEPWSRVHLGGSRWVTVKASRLGAEIAVSIEPATTAERLDLFARAHGLSDREAQVIGLLGIGLDTREIAGQLFLSEHTVNDHVKAVLAKAGARTRQVLLARIAGAA
ncbi:LuxR family transcriptional regulator [Nocardioides marmoriginsengisoli]|uniref:LuxR family transcriptional regulator n=1 Tax=Nocardioides marmoriginsengisoli TaxID=661483 RepID=A0A3N0CIQ8_9ACTN|nr:LuxR family transcriptional regulator [Nocardioides marmoriginsengisoli]